METTQQPTDQITQWHASDPARHIAAFTLTVEADDRDNATVRHNHIGRAYFIAAAVEQVLLANPDLLITFEAAVSRARRRLDHPQEAER